MLYLGASGAWFTFFPALSRAILDNALVPRRCAKFVVQYYLPVDNCATNANRCSDPTLKQFTSLKINVSSLNKIIFNDNWKFKRRLLWFLEINLNFTWPNRCVPGDLGYSDRVWCIHIKLPFVWVVSWVSMTFWKGSSLVKCNAHRTSVRPISLLYIRLRYQKLNTVPCHWMQSRPVQVDTFRGAHLWVGWA